MASKLKAYVRYDGTGRIIPGSLILNRFKPKVGNWRQINSKECCRNNECSAPLYERDYLLYNATSVPGGSILYLATNPFENYKMQFQFVSCIDNQPIGDIVTVGPENEFELAWFVPQAILNTGCAIRVRHVCGPDFYSSWEIQLG